MPLRHPKRLDISIDQYLPEKQSPVMHDAVIVVIKVDRSCIQRLLLKVFHFSCSKTVSAIFD